jgi:hypothetical protein
MQGLTCQPVLLIFAVPRARGAGKCLAFTWLFTKISFLRITKLIVIAMTLYP